MRLPRASVRTPIIAQRMPARNEHNSLLWEVLKFPGL